MEDKSRDIKILDDITHVLHRPNTYIGATEPSEKEEWVLDDEGLAIVVFDTDVSTWNESENKKLSALRLRYSKHKRVILCDSMPSIEFWFLIHFINTNKYFGTSKAVIAELVKFIPKFDKCESFLSNKKWVEELCQEGKFIDACTRAKQMGSEGDSYSNLWKAFDYLGVFVTKESK